MAEATSGGHKRAGEISCLLLVFHSLRTVLTQPLVPSLVPHTFRGTAWVPAESQQVR